MVEKFKLLYIHNLLEPWEAVFRTEFQDTWIEAVIRSIDGEGRAGIQTRVNNENLAHQIKTQVNIDAKSIRKLSKTIFDQIFFSKF